MQGSELGYRSAVCHASTVEPQLSTASLATLLLTQSQAVLHLRRRPSTLLGSWALRRNRAVMTRCWTARNGIWVRCTRCSEQPLKDGIDNSIDSCVLYTVLHPQLICKTVMVEVVLIVCYHCL